MDEHDDELARLLEHARADGASAEVLADVRGKLMTAIASGPGPSDGGASAAGGAPSVAIKLALPIKLAASVLGMGAVAALVAVLGGQEAAPPARRAEKAAAPQVVASPALEDGPGAEPPVAIEPAVPDAGLREAKTKKRTARKAPPAIVATPEPAPAPAPSPSFAEELALIKVALAAQREGRIEDARAKLAEHARRFPEGQLANERRRIEGLLSQ